MCVRLCMCVSVCAYVCAFACACVCAFACACGGGGTGNVLCQLLVQSRGLKSVIPR